MGSRIDGKMLKMVMGLPLTNDLKLAADMGLIVCVSERSKLYRFAHLSLQNGACTLIGDEEKDSFHSDIGCKMWQ